MSDINKRKGAARADMMEREERGSLTHKKKYVSERVRNDVEEDARRVVCRAVQNKYCRQEIRDGCSEG